MYQDLHNDEVQIYHPAIYAYNCQCLFLLLLGNVDVSVDGPSHCEVKKKDTHGSTTNYVFVPMSPGEYSVALKVKGKHIHGSPFSCKVSGEELKL